MTIFGLFLIIGFDDAIENEEEDDKKER